VFVSIEFATAVNANISSSIAILSKPLIFFISMSNLQGLFSNTPIQATSRLYLSKHSGKYDASAEPLVADSARLPGEGTNYCREIVPKQERPQYSCNYYRTVKAAKVNSV
jgi:hypothetical protein